MLDFGKFQAQEAAAALQHPEGFRQRHVDMRHVADAEGDRIGVEGLAVEGQFLGIGLDEIEIVGEAASSSARSAPTASIEPLMSSTVACALRPRPRRCERRCRRCRRQRRARDRSGPRRIERGHHGILPDPVQAARHHVVHDVVALGDLVEDVVDQSLLFALRRRRGSRRRFPCRRRPKHVVWPWALVPFAAGMAKRRLWRYLAHSGTRPSDAPFRANARVAEPVAARQRRRTSRQATAREPMPELPEVETVRRGLAPVMEGARIDKRRTASRPTCAFPSRPVSRHGSPAGAIIASAGGQNIC